MEMIANYLEWIGCVAGLLGAFLLATNTHISRYGWLAFIVANIALIAFSIDIGRFGLLLQQLGFTATSLLGIYRAGFLTRS
jgi:nicotinamide riboside transporter PnuC